MRLVKTTILLMLRHRLDHRAMDLLGGHFREEASPG